MGRLAGKSAFVTSAGAGIGRASAIAMAQEGATVTATDIDEAALESLGASSENITTFKLDALDPDAIKAAAERVGAPDILFNCSGFVHNGTVLDASDEDFDFSLVLMILNSAWNGDHQYGFLVVFFTEFTGIEHVVVDQLSVRRLYAEL